MISFSLSKSKYISLIIFSVLVATWLFLLIYNSFNVLILLWGPVVILVAMLMAIYTHLVFDAKLSNKSITLVLKHFDKFVESTTKMLPQIANNGIKKWKLLPSSINKEIKDVIVYSNDFPLFVKQPIENILEDDTCRRNLEQGFYNLLDSRINIPNLLSYPAQKQIEARKEEIVLEQTKQSLYKTISSTEQIHSKYNWHKLTWDDIEEICRNVGLTIVEEKGFTRSQLQSLLIAINIHQKENQYNWEGIISLTSDLPLIIKKIMALREIGHWQLHLKKQLDAIKLTGQQCPEGFVLSPNQASQYDIERDALIFALVGSFPTQQIQWDEEYQGEKIDKQYFMKLIDSNNGLSNEEKNNVCGCIEGIIKFRIEGYQKFKIHHLQNNIQVLADGPIVKDSLPVCKKIFNHLPWVELDENAIIKDVSDIFMKIVNETKDQIIGNDLLVYAHDEMKTRKEIIWNKRKQLKRSYYAFKYREGTPIKFNRGWAVSWPLIDTNQKFCGSFGVMYETAWNTENKKDGENLQ